jgi:hypothetical protein
MIASGAPRFVARPTPLPPSAAVAEGAAARRLAERLLARTDDALVRLAGAAGPGIIAVIGAAEDLPWVDGVLYLGRDPDAPALLLPTALSPDAPLPLWERALLSATGAASPPRAVLPGPLRVLPLGGARPVQRAALAAWIAGAAR